MIETYYAGVYWSGRKESVEQCARRAEAFFRLLSCCDSIFARWFEKADSLEEALQLQFEPSYATFVRLFGQKEYQPDRSGFMFGSWTGHEEDGRGAMVRFTCGTESDAFPNNCLLHLPWPEQRAEGARVLSVPVLANLLRAMVLAWEPDTGVVVSSDFRDEMRREGDERESAGWLMYLSRTRGEVPPLPTPVRAEAVEDKGTLIILAPERLSASNPAHLALGRRVQEVLDAKELLRPVVSRAALPSV